MTNNNDNENFVDIKNNYDDSFSFYFPSFDLLVKYRKKIWILEIVEK